jgi:hypothetical protein
MTGRGAIAGGGGGGGRTGKAISASNLQIRLKVKPNISIQFMISETSKIMVYRSRKQHFSLVLGTEEDTEKYESKLEKYKSCY